MKGVAATALALALAQPGPRAMAMPAPGRPVEVQLDGCTKEFANVGDAFNDWWVGADGGLYHKVDGMMFEVDSQGERTTTPASCGAQRGPTVAAAGVVPKPESFGEPEEDSDTDLDESMVATTLLARAQSAARAPMRIQPVTAVKNLVLMVQFSDHSTSALPTVSQYDELFNSDGETENAPTGSVKTFYQRNSMGSLEIDNVLSGWITVSYTEAQASGGCKGTCWSARLRSAITEALRTYEQQVGATFFRQFDGDGDGEVDLFTVVHSGAGAEQVRHLNVGGNWIWSHKSSLGYTTPLTRMRFPAYNINPGRWWDEDWESSGGTIGHLGVITHEMGHFMGVPDLYDSDRSSQGMGVFGIMANSWGPDWSQLYPSSVSAPVKFMFGWLTPVDLMELVPSAESKVEEVVDLPAVQGTNKAFMIRLTSDEYFMIENRLNTGYDGARPGGVLIWHVDMAMYRRYERSNGVNKLELDPNRPSTWASNHYAIRLIQPDGRYDLESNSIPWLEEGTVDKGDYFGWVPGEELSDANAPMPNINRYSRLGQPSGISLSNFEPVGSSTMPAQNMRFTFRYDGSAAGQRSPETPSAPTPTGSEGPAAAPSPSNVPMIAGAAAGGAALVALATAGLVYRRRASAPAASVASSSVVGSPDIERQAAQ